ncbi:MAG: polysaccharide biosynthesis C-terminal domain-containing protein [Salibacteraceae bacterium]
MGIIFRQSFKSSIYSYLGAIIGFVNVGILMTRFLTPAEIGVRMQIQSYSVIVSSFIAFGLPYSVIRMFPHFKNEKKKNHGLLTLLGVVGLISIAIFLVGFYFLGDWILADDLKNSSLFSEYYSLILVFAIANLFFMFADSYATANKESTIGIFAKDIVLRGFIFLLLLAFILFESFHFREFIISFTYLQWVPGLFIFLFLLRKGFLHFTRKISFPSKAIKKEFISVSTFNWVNVLSAVAIASIDSVMLSKLEGSESVGIYTILFFFAGLMLIPIKSLGKITNSVVAEKFKENKLGEISSIFQKSSLNPFIIGLFLFGNLIIITPFIFQVILKNQYDSGFWVLIFLACANLIKMSSGVKFIIISNSRYFKWVTGFQAFFIFLLVTTNLIFIPLFGVNGAALASLISSFIYHITGLVFLKRKLNMWPFSYNHLKLLIVFLIMGIVIYLLPDFNFPVIGSVLKSGIFSLLYGLFILKSKISPEIDNQVSGILKMAKKH